MIANGRAPLPLAEPLPLIGNGRAPLPCGTTTSSTCLPEPLWITNSAEPLEVAAVTETEAPVDTASLAAVVDANKVAVAILAAVVAEESGGWREVGTCVEAAIGARVDDAIDDRVVVPAVARAEVVAVAVVRAADVTAMGSAASAKLASASTSASLSLRLAMLLLQKGRCRTARLLGF